MLLMAIFGYCRQDEQQIKVIIEGADFSHSEQGLTTHVDNTTLYIAAENLLLAVYLSEKLYDFLRISGDSGQISVEQLNAMEVNLETIGGEIQLKHVNTQNICVNCDDGTVSVEGLNAENVSMGTIDGRIQLENVASQSTYVKSDNGKINLKNVEGNLTWDGDITVA